MKHVLWPALLLSSSLALAQGADDKKPSGPGSKPGTPRKAAPKKAEPPPPDVARLPFTPDSIRQVMEYHSRKIQACYEDVMLTRHKKVEGRLMTNFTITPDGLVKDARVVKKGTTVDAPGLHDCVVAVLHSLDFPKPADGRHYPIEYPFNLKAIE